MDGSIMLGKVLSQVDCARKIQFGFMDTSVLRKHWPLTRKQLLSAPKGTTRLIRAGGGTVHINVRVDTEEGRVISAVLAL